MTHCTVSLMFCVLSKFRSSPFLGTDSVHSNMYSAVGPGGKCTVADIQCFIAFLETLSL